MLRYLLHYSKRRLYNEEKQYRQKQKISKTTMRLILRYDLTIDEISKLSTNTLDGIDFITSNYGYQVVVTNHKFIFVGVTDNKGTSKQSIGYLLSVFKSKVVNYVDNKFNTLQIYITGLKTNLLYLFIAITNSRKIDTHLIIDAGTTKTSGINYTIYLLHTNDCLQYRVVDYKTAMIDYKITFIPFLFV